MSRAHDTLQWLRSEPHGARSDEEKLERLARAIVEDSIRTLDCFAVGEDIRTNPECCQLFMSEKQAEEYRRTWNPKGGWAIWPIAIHIDVPE